MKLNTKATRLPSSPRPPITHMPKYLPQGIVSRRKEPFSLPIVEWLKEDLKEYLTDVLSEESVKRHGLLNAACVQYALKEFYKYPNQKEYYGQMLWTMAMLERWAFLYM